jgi:hypothetical protein
MFMKEEPHHTNMGWAEVRIIRTQVFKLWSQFSGSPSGVVDQSKLRMRSPISPPPDRKSNCLVIAMCLSMVGYTNKCICFSNYRTMANHSLGNNLPMFRLEGIINIFICTLTCFKEKQRQFNRIMIAGFPMDNQVYLLFLTTVI